MIATEISAGSSRGVVVLVTVACSVCCEKRGGFPMICKQYVHRATGAVLWRIGFCYRGTREPQIDHLMVL
jgi:hypothetical protein